MCSSMVFQTKTCHGIPWQTKTDHGRQRQTRVDDANGAVDAGDTDHADDEDGADQSG